MGGGRRAESRDDPGTMSDPRVGEKGGKGVKSARRSAHAVSRRHRSGEIERFFTVLWRRRHEDSGTGHGQREFASDRGDSPCQRSSMLMRR